MINIIDKLVELQNLRAASAPLSPTAQSLELAFRAEVPKPVLDHYDRLIASGKTGVAFVRHGVCGGCHLRLCSGTAAGLARHDDIYICDNCGRYLYMAPEDPVKPEAVSAALVEKPHSQKVRKPRQPRVKQVAVAS
jgi:predicted  nucleic acid-binding Zn-ribbon protein